MFLRPILRGMPFGKYKGTRLEYVPVDYLQWLLPKLDDGNLKDTVQYVIANQAKWEAKENAIPSSGPLNARQILEAGCA